MTGSGPPATGGSVTVAMLTYRRPEFVDAVVAVLDQFDVCDDVTGELLIVDNDPAGTARVAAEQFSGRGLRYVHEPRPGIPAARNRALDEVADDRLLLFIDDDEIPSERWLSHMVAAHRRFGGAGVVGPVISEFNGQMDAWTAAGRFFDRRRLPTGSPVTVAATNNLLLDMAEISVLGLRFDERFTATGGSDTLFSRQLTAAGRVLVWCDEAVVTDRVPASRLTRRWVMQRAFRSGNSWTATSLVLARSRRARLAVRATCLARGGVRMLGGGGQVATGVVRRSLGLRARGTRTVARGAGMVAGTVGFNFREYSASAEVHSLRGPEGTAVA